MLSITRAVRTASLGLTLLALVLPSAAAAAEPATPDLIDAADRSGRISDDTANLYRAYAIGEQHKLPAAYRSDTPWDGTLTLLKLRREIARMPRGAARERIEDPISAQHSGASCAGRSAGPSSLDSANFHIDFSSIGGGLTAAQYKASLEAAWNREAESFGWARPPVAPNPPPGNRYHVVVANLGSGLYGLVSSGGTHAGSVVDNPNTPWNEGDSLASCMVLNRDYSSFGNAQAALDATTAHEFNHSIQYGYGAADGPNVPDDIFFEGGATWMEDEVFDSANDNYFYLYPDFSESMGAYEEAALDPNPYAYWIAFRGMTERYGPGVLGGSEQVMQEFWERTSQETGNNLTAMNEALQTRGTTLADAFHAYAIAVKFNKACGADYVAPYCFEEGPAYIASRGTPPVDGTVATIGGSALHSIEDNYSLGWIALPTGGSYNVTLENLSAGGELRGTVVCDTGSGLRTVTMPGAAGPGGSITIQSFNTVGCTSTPVAAVSNEAQTMANPPTSVTRQFRVSTAAAGASPTLGVTIAGSGTGTVTSTDAGISCGADCSENYADNSSVDMTATAAPGSTFERWVGACSGTATCTAAMTDATSVTAVFSAPPNNAGANNPGPARTEPDPPGSASNTGSTSTTTTPPPPDLLAPALTTPRLSSRRFRAARSGPSASARTGTRVRYTSSEAGRTTFTVERARTGRRVGRSCRRPTRGNRSRRRCTRWVKVRGSFSRATRSGTNRFTFRGRMRDRRLALGTHRLVAVTRDGAGNRSRTRRSARFTIVRR